jgi:hypothetical protein
MRATFALSLLLAACSGPKSGDPAAADNAATPAAETPAPAPADNAAVPPADVARLEADYLGRWVGVEGMYLDVSKRAGGGVDLEMQYDLDHKGTFQGSVTVEGLRFLRNGVAETAVPSEGDATGLKYLAGKKDCLTVKPGEGYCRD